MNDNNIILPSPLRPAVFLKKKNSGQCHNDDYQYIIILNSFNIDQVYGIPTITKQK